ncbi:Uncharacterised protein [Clostridium baratii]|uniref:hypothetical protein n=1 Tax=Clostridium baratii TaxID=1561 RepID=UPI0006BF771F|nr:hypothetical protein [Clostridium baratii]CUO91443.1 Uncharacterised protein [Clostridium baratii]
MNDREYLENKLQELKFELEDININQKIAVAEFETKRKILDREICSIEVQLFNEGSQ